MNVSRSCYGANDRFNTLRHDIAIAVMTSPGHRHYVRNRLVHLFYLTLGQVSSDRISGICGVWLSQSACDRGHLNWCPDVSMHPSWNSLYSVDRVTVMMMRCTGWHRCPISGYQNRLLALKIVWTSSVSISMNPFVPELILKCYYLCMRLKFGRYRHEWVNPSVSIITRITWYCRLSHS